MWLVYQNRSSQTLSFASVLLIVTNGLLNFSQQVLRFDCFHLTSAVRPQWQSSQEMYSFVVVFFIGSGVPAKKPKKSHHKHHKHNKRHRHKDLKQNDHKDRDSKKTELETHHHSTVHKYLLSSLHTFELSCMGSLFQVFRTVGYPQAVNDLTDHYRHYLNSCVVPCRCFRWWIICWSTGPRYRYILSVYQSACEHGFCHLCESAFAFR